MRKNSKISEAFLKIRNDTIEEITRTDWWRFKKVYHLRNRLRWASYHYEKNKKRENNGRISK